MTGNRVKHDFFAAEESALALHRGDSIGDNFFKQGYHYMAKAHWINPAPCTTSWSWIRRRVSLTRRASHC